MVKDVKEDTSIVIIQKTLMFMNFRTVVKIILIKLSLSRKIVSKNLTEKTQINVNVPKQKMVNHISCALSTRLFTASLQSWSVMDMLPVITLRTSC